MSGPPGSQGYQQYPQSYGQQPAFQQQPPPFAQQPPAFGSPGGPPPFGGNPAFGPPQQYSASPAPPIGQAFLPPFQGGPPQPYPSTSPQPPFTQQGQFQPPSNGTPLQVTQRPSSLPAPPGLPQRPAFEPPPLTATEMEKLHQGQVPESDEPPQQNHPTGASPNQAYTNVGITPGAGKVDGLGSAVAKAVDAFPKLSKEEERKAKKEREKNMKLIYSDNEVSPEEKMAEMPRYAFAPVTA